MTGDCCFINDHCTFRYRASALLVQEGRVLLMRSASRGSLNLPGGAVHLDEAAADAARRELHEETGIETEAERLLALHECFYDDSTVPNQRVHVVELVFLMRPASLLPPLPAGNDVESPCWLPLNALEEERLFPMELCACLKEMPAQVQHWITRENTPPPPLLTADCCFTEDACWFRYRAAAIIQEGGQTLLAHYVPGNYDYAIGGGVHLDETCMNAVRRETWEETGIHYEIDHLAVLCESFFDGQDTLLGKRAHVLEVYFLMKPQGSLALHPPAGEEACAHFLPVEALPSMTVFPQFLADYLNRKPQDTLHIVERENEAPTQEDNTDHTTDKTTDRG